MKTRAFFIYILLVSTYIFSQDEIGLPKLKPADDYWGIGYYGSGVLGLNNGFARSSVHPGFGGMFEFIYKDPLFHTVLLIGENNISSGNPEEHYESVEFTIGPRFDFTQSKNDFAEVTLGTLLVRRVTEFLITTHEYGDISSIHKSDPEFSFAASASFGKEFPLDKAASLVLKLRLLNAYPVKNELFSFVNLTAGVMFYNKNIKGNKKIRKDFTGFGIAALAGGNNGSLLSKGDYNWGQNYNIEFSYSINPKTEIVLSYNSNSINGINRSHNYKESSNNTGVNGRFLVSENRLTSFFECGGGIYEHSYYASSLGVTGEVYDETNVYPGFNAGTGIMYTANSYVDFLARCNLHFLFSDKYDFSSDFLTLQGGVRFNL